MTQTALLHVLDLFDDLAVVWWLDGGWGVDVLFGRQTREHEDVDIDFDAAHTRRVTARLEESGFILTADQLPVRAEFISPALGKLDIHPFAIDDEIVRQADPAGGFWEFPKEYFGKALFAGRSVPCISLEGQKAFHRGYHLREKDLHDLQILKLVEERASSGRAQ